VTGNSNCEKQLGMILRSGFCPKSKDKQALMVIARFPELHS
jgi:hypothetical protein